MKIRRKRPAARRATCGKKAPLAAGRRAAAIAGATLAVGVLGTLLLERALLAPSGRVGAASALPVLSAVGQSTDEVSFWPQLFREEHGRDLLAQDPLREEDDYLLDPLLALASGLLGGGVEIEAGAGQRLMLGDGDRNAAVCVYLDDLPVTWRPEGGPAAETPLTMDFACGGETGAAFGQALTVRLIGAGAPTADQLAAGYAKVLLDIYCSTGLADTVLAGRGEAQAASTPDEEGVGAASLTALENASPWQMSETLARINEPVGQLLAAPSMDLYIFGYGYAGDAPVSDFWYTGDAPDPAALAAGEMPLEEQHRLERLLQQEMAAKQIDLQIVTLPDSVLALFSSGGISLGLYYDPALRAYSGLAIQ